MAETLKNKNARAAKVTGYAAETTANILVYLNALEADMKSGNVTGVIEKCNSRTRALDVQDLIGRPLKYGEGELLLDSSKNMTPGILARANSTAELMQDLRKITRTNCRFQTFTGPLAMLTGIKKELRTNTGIVKKMG